MRFSLFLLAGAGAFLMACTASFPAGQWPETKFNRAELERVSLDGRIIVVEQVPRFPAAGHGATSNVDAAFDQYLFWDFCRGPEAVWQMVTLRPDSRARSGWSYTRTVVEPASRGHAGSTRVTEGLLHQRINGFAALRAAGLAFFKPGAMRCDAQYGDLTEAV
jgi:hypothetical protein